MKDYVVPHLMELENSFGDWFDGKFETPKMTKNLYPYDKIFSPIEVGNCIVKNRLVMAPMGNISMCDETGRPTRQMVAYFEERAKGGMGLITTGLVPISYGVDSSLIEVDKLVYFPRIDRSRTVFAGWRDLTSACHSHGSKIFLQLSAGLGRVGNPQCLITQLKLPVSASWNPSFYIPQIPCRRLSDGEARKVVKQFGQGAADGKACNFDGVYLHGHEGYLLEQMTNGAFNRRKFGRYSKPAAFGIETVEEIRKRVGPKFPIMYRIDLSLMLNEVYGNKMKTEKSLMKFRNGRTVDETLKFMADLVKAGVDMFDVDLGCYDNWWLPHPPASMPAGCFLSISKIVKDYFKQNNIKSNLGKQVPVVGVGKLGYPDLAEKALRDEKCDMIMLGRPVLADPEWANKAYRGDVADIRPCIGCQLGCINEFVEGGHPQCAVNARCSFELELPPITQTDAVTKKVAIVGAGPAGLTAAEVLLQKGHTVDVYEKSKHIGGSAYIGSLPKIKYEMASYIAYLEDKVKLWQNGGKFNIYLNTEVSVDTLKDKGYDVIMVGGGSVQTKPPVPGIDGKNVVNAIDVIENPKLVEKAETVLVVGGGDVGCEAAYMLKYELKKDVILVEMMEQFMAKSCTANRGHLLHYLEKAHVDMLNCTKLKQVEDGKAVLLMNTHKNVPNPLVTWHPILPENISNPLAKKVGCEYKEVTVKCDMVVLASGNRPNCKLYYDILDAHIAKEVYNIGDSNVCGQMHAAIKSAYRRARDI